MGQLGQPLVAAAAHAQSRLGRLGLPNFWAGPFSRFAAQQSGYLAVSAALRHRRPSRRLLSTSPPSAGLSWSRGSGRVNAAADYSSMFLPLPDLRSASYPPPRPTDRCCFPAATTPRGVGVAMDDLQLLEQFRIAVLNQTALAGWRGNDGACRFPGVGCRDGHYRAHPAAAQHR
ncbi:hypothetical protein E2562_015103 [Oryza meyeriana var. granulata]|uniref:Uncharacterized protein n=1 Tax=Oryza meyeriana var. granulata TaxID=110450 RepID=A0A6G1DWR1_9ORYZ|nr:hypothetical protein E2562_015103 [Oryza meyeriana var. granulata]